MGGKDKGPKLRRAAIVINPASGSVGPQTEGQARALVESLEIEARIFTISEHSVEATLNEALACGPDLLAVIAGDGTARAAAVLCGPDGPLCAPLPGGTMNVLPRALYGARHWQAALTDALEDRVVRDVSGGEIDGELFFVAAILGSPALWAEAREAAREMKPLTAVRLAQHALDSAFKGRLRYDLEGHEPGRAEALTLLCPLISHELANDERVLEAAAVDPGGAAGVFRLAFHALVDNWRADPGVETWRCRKGRARARGRIPAVIDGEPIKLGREATIGFRSCAFRALTPRIIHPEDRSAAAATAETTA
jgi:diacylglycerol kinase family enzyme